MKKYPVTKPYFTDEEIQLISDSLNSGWVAQGPKVAEFEKQTAKHEGISEGVATTSCTTALHLAMVAYGLKAGMDAIAPAFTFVATTNAIVMTGAVPVLCDIRQDTFNIDTENLRQIIENQYESKNGRLINKKTGNVLWGIVPVHEFGLCCDIYEVNKLATEYNLTVIEDAACALGAKINGIHQGAFGNASCISFHPRKSITTGEGGMVLTDDSNLAKRMRELRTHGSTVSADARDKGKGFLLPEFNEAGYNYRMTDVQGAMGLAQIKKLDTIIEEKRKGAVIYNELISDILPEFITPVEPEGYFHTYQSYVCMLNLEVLGIGSVEEGGKYRNTLLEKLEAIGIATRQGTHAVHMLGYYKNRFGYVSEDYVNAYACDHLSITLPLYVGISRDDQEDIVRNIRKTVDAM
ncbi:DegT/DnrJ/EryC1/StrS family aminotransferase [Anaerovibrio lipolyticus]|uniref:DegT/DnrJ/EryC1/StrS family aminotransferase n=1 Tax=Anaerovibrio lipolyticus TaxID=82374 RepID=UPI00056D6193|nr:DegT/DnrJ/EryC1/StrS family aminotransferase [Anaerovibrio lipolyticus]